MLETKDRRISELEVEVSNLHKELQMSVGECRRLADFKNQLERDNSMITERVREIELLVSDREHAINMKNQNAQQVSYYEKFFCV